MKKFTLLLLIVCSLGYAAEQEKKSSLDNAFLRGTINVLTSWLEVPRELCYENSKLPVLGTIPGAVKGVSFTFLRTFAGVVDILSMGYSGDGIYDEFVPKYVWQAPWIDQKSE